MLTRQEMFDRAVRGLRSQGFERCLGSDGGCSYSDGKGHHCAWGWVDTSLGDIRGSVYKLHTEGHGIASALSEDDVEFARRLQAAHDCYDLPEHMERALRKLGKGFGLTWPEEGTAP